MAFEIASAAPGTVKAASPAFGFSGARGSTAASRLARASAISRLCRLTHTPEQLIQLRPLFAYTLSKIKSKYFSQSSTQSSPRMTLEKPGP